MLALPRVHALHIVHKAVGKLVVLQSPLGCHKQFFRRLAYKSFEHHIRSQSFDESPAQVYVLVGGVEAEGLALVFGCKLGAAYYLQLVQL